MGWTLPIAGLGAAGDLLLLVFCFCTLIASCQDLEDLQCFRPGQNSGMNCTWTDKANTTTDAIYTLFYRSLKYHSRLPSPTKASVPRGQSWVVVSRENLTVYDTCEVWVEGVSGSWRAASPHLQIDMQAIVLLSPPRIFMEDESDPDSCSVMVTWEHSTQQHDSDLRRCELRYRELAARNWTRVISEGDGHCNTELLELTPFTLYEVQTRYLPINGSNLGSDWSEPLLFRSPEAAPMGTVDVWRSVEDGGSGLRVMWKALDPSTARSHNLTYSLTFRERGGSGHVLRSAPCCNVSLPGAVEYISISANNSVGQTEPSTLSLELTDLPAPAQLRVQSVGGRALNVSWVPTESPVEGLQEYLLEWRSVERRSAGGIDWKRHAASMGQHSVLVTGDSFQAGMPYQVSVYALYRRGFGGPASSLCYIQELVPSRSPNVSVSGLSATKVLVTLGEVPLMERRGLITHYTIYVTRGGSAEVIQQRNVFAVGTVTVSELEPSTQYQLRVTASTSAGESPGSVYPFLTPGDSLATVISSTLVTALLVAGCVLGLVFHKRIRRLGRAVLPKFCWQEIPDPVHCKLAFKAPDCEDIDEWQSFGPRNLELSTGSEEPPITEVEEVEDHPGADGCESDSSGAGLEWLGGAVSAEPVGPGRGVESRPPIISGYEKHFMPSPEDLTRFT